MLGYNSIGYNSIVFIAFDKVGVFCDNFTLFFLTLLHSEWPKLYGVLAVLSATGLKTYCDPSPEPRKSGSS